MKIICPVQLVPDLVEELVISGTRLDPDETSWLLNEFDDNAIEQAILFKESLGAHVTILAPDIDGADDALFTAHAKGANELVKLVADFEDEEVNTHQMAKMYLEFLKENEADLILTGVQAHDSLDGAIGPVLAEWLGMPYVGYVSGIKVDGESVVVDKEYPGGIIAKMEVALPAVIGIQASETPPRYVPFSKIRQSMKTASMEEIDGEIEDTDQLPVTRMFLPEPLERAEMLEGDEEEVAEKIIELLKTNGLL
jgi:electron transfer flavoprotein beta subunit